MGDGKAGRQTSDLIVIPRTYLVEEESHAHSCCPFPIRAVLWVHAHAHAQINQYINVHSLKERMTLVCCE